MGTATKPGQSEKLLSWKEIAAFLDRDVRTVRRWEEERGLPVHRIPGGKGASVFAYTNELEDWLRHDSQQEISLPESSAHPLPNSTRQIAQVMQVLPPSESPDAPPLRQGRRTLALGIAAALIVLLLLGGVGLHFRTRAHERLDHVSFSGNKLLVWNGAGKLAWDYWFPLPLYQTIPLDNSRLVRIVDLNGDGGQELLATVGFSVPHTPTARHVLYTFSEDGRLLWRYEPQYKLEFSGRTYEGPWRATEMLVSPGPGPEPPGWPLLISPGGQAL